MARRIATFWPHALHIATEVRWAGLRAAIASTGSALHDLLPHAISQYLHSRLPIPIGFSTASCAGSTVRSTLHGQHQTMSDELAARGSEPGPLAARRRHAAVQTRSKEFIDLPRPVAAYVGRVAIEKISRRSCACPGRLENDHRRWPGAARLQSLYPTAHFKGFRFGEDLAAHLAAATLWYSRADRHLWAGEPRSDGVRSSGGGLPVTGRSMSLMTESLARWIPTSGEPRSGTSNRCARLPGTALRSSWVSCAHEFEHNLVACQTHGVPFRTRARPIPQRPELSARRSCAGAGD